MGSWYRPYQMFLNEADYTSKAVNTDGHGLRLQYKKDGCLLRLEDCCEGMFDIMLGGSSVFGVDASSDLKTLPAFFSSAEVPCLNWGIRGASTQHELLCFLFFKRYVRNIRQVILFSGVNLCSLASMEDVMIYPDQGALFSEEYYNRQSLENLRAGSDVDASLEVALASLGRRFKRLYERRAVFRFLLRLFTCKKKSAAPPIRLPERNISGFHKRMEALLVLLENELETWAALSRGGGFRLRYVLQPALRWALKAENDLEEECLREDLRVHPQNGVFGTMVFRQAYSARIAAICRRLGVDYTDANDMLSGADGSRSVFTDLCHLTDYGNELVAGRLRDAFNVSES